MRDDRTLLDKLSPGLGKVKTTINVGFIALLLASIVPVSLMVRQDSRAVREKKRLRFMYWGGPEQLVQERDVCRAFLRQMKAEGRDDIDLEPIPANAHYASKLQAMISSHDAPDVYMVAPNAISRFADRDVPLLVDITDRVAAERLAEQGVPAAERQLDFDDFVPDAIRTFCANGRLWGFPRDYKSTGVGYNADLLAKHGLADPNDLYERNEWTWEKFREYLEVLNDPEHGVWALFQDNFNEGYWHNILLQAGGGIFSDDGKELIIDRAESIAGLQFVYDLAWTHGLAKPWAAEIGAKDPWESQETAMLGIRGWHVPGKVARTYNAKTGAFNFAWDVAPWPLGPELRCDPQRVSDAAGKIVGWKLPSGRVVPPAAVHWASGQEGQGPLRLRQCGVTGIGYVISVDSKHPDEAWRLLKFLASPEAQRIRAGFTLKTAAGEQPIAGINMPSRRSVEEHYLDMARKCPVRPTFTGSLAHKNAQTLWPRVDVFLAGRYYGRPSVGAIGQDEVMRELNRQFEKMIAVDNGGRFKPEDVARETRIRAERIYARLRASPFQSSFNTPSLVRPATDDPLGLRR